MGFCCGSATGDGDDGRVSRGKIIKKPSGEMGVLGYDFEGTESDLNYFYNLDRAGSEIRPLHVDEMGSQIDNNILV